ncbi:hypothetical protein EXA91_22875, partial [Salmonella enterica subsp. enterica serovar Nottingham]|nr:hypothetical protein [Salmonella enterica subsp. enterica serovar Nottingham]
MNNQDLKIGTAFISMIYFPLGFLVSLIEVINGYRWGNFLFAFILGLLAFSLIPYSDWDLTRHYETYLSYNNTSFSEVWEQSDNRYLVINTIIYLFNAFAIKKEFLPFFAVFISYLFYLNVFSKFIREKKPNILIRSIYLYILLTVIPFFAIASSLRQYLAFSIILYIIITYCSKQDR